jgi:hypothetical protein
MTDSEIDDRFDLISAYLKVGAMGCWRFMTFWTENGSQLLMPKA